MLLNKQPAAEAEKNLTRKLESKLDRRGEPSKIQRLPCKTMSVVIEENTLESQEDNKSACKCRTEVSQTRKCLVPSAVGKENVALNNHGRGRSSAASRKVPKLKNTKTEKNGPLALPIGPQKERNAELPVEMSMQGKSLTASKASKSPLAKQNNPPISASPVKAAYRSLSMPVAGKESPKTTSPIKRHLQSHNAEKQVITKQRVNDRLAVNQDAPVALTSKIEEGASLMLLCRVCD